MISSSKGNKKELSQFPEGTFFSLPLEDGRFAVGIIARRSPSKGKYLGHFGYFWGPYLSVDACRINLDRLSPKNAQLNLITSGLHLKSGRWSVIGQKEPWDRKEWPFPDFYQHPPGTNIFYRVRFDEDDIGRMKLQELIPDTQNLDEYSVSGAAAAEIKLSKAMGARISQKSN